MLETLRYISDLAQIPLNIIGFVALVISIITFFAFLQNKYAKALKDILSPCGCSFFPRLRILFTCRHSLQKKRAFIEFALLKTQGQTIVTSQWYDVINEFKRFFSEHSDRLLYTIPNCTVLIGEPLSQGIERYFDCFRSPRLRKKFGLSEEGLSWTTAIRIREAYATPTCLLMGLLSKYEENWSEFVRKYVSTAHFTGEALGREDSILSNELYLTFAWLLWGPSYELPYEDCWNGICQVSFGDESNSIAAIAESNSSLNGRMAKVFRENADHQYGALVSMDITLWDKKRYFQGIRSQLSPDHGYFLDKVEETQAFAAQIMEFTPFENYMSRKYYCTAYVWLLFELEDPEDLSFRPETSVAFFEHANLADNQTYAFLTETLIDKCFAHFRRVYSDPDCSGRSYRFVCAMNRRIGDRFAERYGELVAGEDPLAGEFARRLLLEPRHSATAVFSKYDSFFTNDRTLEFQEVSIRDKASITALGLFYTQVYLECFPEADERETLDNLLLYLKNSTEDQNFTYHILLARNEDRILGGCVFDYFRPSNCGVIEYIAVHPELQTSGIGSRLYREVRSILEQDARRNRKQMNTVFCEIEKPEERSNGRKGEAGVRGKGLPFWNKNGFRRLDFDYIQPALSPTQQPVENLYFNVCVLNGNTGALPKEQVLAVLRDYMTYAMSIETPETHPVYQRMVCSLEGVNEIRLLSLLPQDGPEREVSVP